MTLMERLRIMLSSYPRVGQEKDNILAEYLVGCLALYDRMQERARQRVTRELPPLDFPAIDPLTGREDKPTRKG